jgi:hypothetical protein
MLAGVVARPDQQPRHRSQDIGDSPMPEPRPARRIRAVHGDGAALICDGHTLHPDPEVTCGQAALLSRDPIRHPDHVRKPGERSDLPTSIDDRDAGANPFRVDSRCGTRPSSEVFNG